MTQEQTDQTLQNTQQNMRVKIMIEIVVTLIVGILCIAMGISNMKGNISTLHSYHRNRVSEEDRIPFGRKVGLGTVIIGTSISVFSAFAAVTLHTDNQLYIKIGYAVLTAGMLPGILITLLAIKKYNKSIF